MRHASVEDDDALDALFERIETGLDLRDHAAGNRAVGDQLAHLGNRELFDQVLVLVEHARHVGEQQEAFGLQRTGDGAREGVGEPEKVDTFVLDTILGRELIPVLAPVCAGADGSSFNVNADTFAGAIAGALKAKRFLLLTDVPGVLDKDKNLIEKLSVSEVRELIADGTISGGMIPKVETCLYALEQGVEGVVILDGKVPHAVLLELFTDHGAGTLIHR